MADREKVRLRKGDFAFLQGGRPDGLYALDDGKLEVLCAPKDYEGLDSNILLSKSVGVAVVTERGPLLRGAYQLRGTRCGKQNCKCTQGELHPTAVLVISEDGKRRSYYVRPS